MLFLWVRTAVDVSDFSVVASYHDTSHPVQELASAATTFLFKKWLPDFRRGSGSFGGLVRPHVSQSHSRRFSLESASSALQRSPLAILYPIINPFVLKLSRMSSVL